MKLQTDALQRFEEIKRKFKDSNKYVLKVDYQDIKDLIFLVEVLGTRNKMKLNSLYGFCASDYISKGRIRQIILELEKQQEVNRNLLHAAIDSLNKYEYDKYSERITVNMLVRDYLHQLLEEEE